MTALAPPIVSALTAGVLILAQMLLLMLTVRMRRKARQSLGDGTDPALQKAVRRHGNFTENAAIFVVALALAEMLGMGRMLVEAMAGLFVASRLLHAVGLSMTRTVNWMRLVGVAGTVVSASVVGVQLVLLSVGRLTP